MKSLRKKINISSCPKSMPLRRQGTGIQWFFLNCKLWIPAPCLRRGRLFGNDSSRFSIHIYSE